MLAGKFTSLEEKHRLSSAQLTAIRTFFSYLIFRGAYDSTFPLWRRDCQAYLTLYCQDAEHVFNESRLQNINLMHYFNFTYIVFCSSINFINNMAIFCGAKWINNQHNEHVTSTNISSRIRIILNNDSLSQATYGIYLTFQYIISWSTITQMPVVAAISVLL